MSSHPLAQQCYEEGFNRRIDAMVKSAVGPRVPSVGALMGGGRGGEMALKGKLLELAVKNPNTGTVANFFKRWQAPYGGLEALDSHKRDFVDHMLRLKQLHREALAAGDASTATRLQSSMHDMQALFRHKQERLYGELGTGAEPRRKLLEVGLPVAAGSAAIGGLAAGGAHLYSKEKSRRDTLGQMGDSTFMDRLKYLMVPKRTMAQRIFNTES